MQIAIKQEETMCDYCMSILQENGVCPYCGRHYEREDE